jgi:hypothetical protein
MVLPMAHRGDVGTDISPASADDPDLARRIDDLLHRTCDLARALTGAEQAALNVTLDAAGPRKFFNLSERYARWRGYAVDPHGLGLHGLAIPPGEVVRLTQAEVEAHPAWRGFGDQAADHPPMRGWLATAVCAEDGSAYGMLQLSDKAGGADFTARDADRIAELAAFAAATLDALRAARAGS